MRPRPAPTRRTAALVAAAVGVWEALPRCAAHKSAVCSSTSESHPGQFIFYVCTYHPNPGGAACANDPVPGKLTIVLPNGRSVDTKFDTWCSLQNSCGGGDAGLPGTFTVEEMAANMKVSSTAGRCAARKDAQGRPLYHPDSILACYEHITQLGGLNGMSVMGGQGLSNNGNDPDRIHCNGNDGDGTTADKRPLKTCYAIVVEDKAIKAGTFTVWTQGTDQNLDPSPKNSGKTPCAMSGKAGAYKLDISVADGLGRCCTKPATDPNAIASTLTYCDGTAYQVFSGFVCSVVCNAGFQRVGTLQCVDGTWTNYECAKTPINVPGAGSGPGWCQPPGQSPGNNANLLPMHPSNTVNLVFDGDPGPGTTPPGAGCGVATKAGTLCNYTCTGDPDPLCSPSRGAKKYPLGYRNTPVVRGTVMCDAAGNWQMGPGYCGCQAWPCAPTPTATMTFDCMSYCSGNAISSTFDPITGTCDCRCKCAWTGKRCDVCPPMYDPVTCCGCAAGRVNYPYCTLCTSHFHCNDHAKPPPTGVTTNAAQTKCVCDCAGHWQGETCSECPESLGFRKEDCATCAQGYIPAYDSSGALHINCDAGVDCCKCDQKKVRANGLGCTYNQATKHYNGRVTSNAQSTECVCICQDMWEGQFCDVCPPQFDQTECNRCVAGLAGATAYPYCGQQCNLAVDCNSHATAVVPNGADCKCTCRSQWTDLPARPGGSVQQCAKCPPQYGGQDCDVCGAGYTGTYPTCTLCTSAANCNGRAGSVTSPASLNPTCVCKCDVNIGQWFGATCGDCDTAVYDATCTGCKAPLVGQSPLCVSPTAQGYTPTPLTPSPAAQTPVPPTPAPPGDTPVPDTPAPPGSTPAPYTPAPCGQQRTPMPPTPAPAQPTPVPDTPAPPVPTPRPDTPSPPVATPVPVTPAPAAGFSGSGAVIQPTPAPQTPAPASPTPCAGIWVGTSCVTDPNPSTTGAGASTTTGAARPATSGYWTSTGVTGSVTAYTPYPASRGGAVAGPDTDDGGGMPTWAIALLSVTGGLILLALLALVVIRSGMLAGGAAGAAANINSPPAGMWGGARQGPQGWQQGMRGVRQVPVRDAALRTYAPHQDAGTQQAIASTRQQGRWQTGAWQQL